MKFSQQILFVVLSLPTLKLFGDYEIEFKGSYSIAQRAQVVR